MGVTMSPIRRILLQYINRGLTSAEELAALIGCSKRKVYYVLEGEKYLFDHEVMTICQHFSSMGHNELSKQFLSGRFGVIPIGDIRINGCLLDENGEITKTMGKLMEHFYRGEKEEGLSLVDDLLKVCKQVKHELKSLD